MAFCHVFRRAGTAAGVERKTCGTRCAPFRWWGCVCGLAWWGWAALGAAFIPAFCCARPGCAFAPVSGPGHPPTVTPITCDALALRRGGKKAGDIKGPALRRVCGHTPACTCFTAYLGLCAAVDCTPRAALHGLGFVLERALSGYAIAAFLWQKTRPCPYLLQRSGPHGCAPRAACTCAHWPPQAWRRRG